MKRLVLAIFATIVLLALVAAGCTEEEPAVSPEGEELVNSCVSCHTDKDLLKEVATPEEGEKSEATSGEG